MADVSSDQSEPERPATAQGARDADTRTGAERGVAAETEAVPASAGTEAGAERDAGTSAEAGATEETPAGPNPRRLLALVFAIAAVALGLDIATKVAVVANLEGGPPVPILGGVVYLDVFRNPGAAFSLATGMTWLLALLAIVVVGVIVWLARKLRSTGWAIGLGLVLGGACGNLVDRFFRAPGPMQGHVVDFISVFAPGGQYYPVFNLADSAIVCGGALVVLLSLLGRDYDGTVHRGKRKQAGS
ncbi:signal peptidase II [Saccharopolyspora erythraea NRRL 2338]|uniref:Lipoprotein signal peptidase n=2 Tax=Saccharopolyspora erythraea TaxID=1836 RepID=A4FLT3_SACEN|nr:signal peptidase II [Saccharopolyspora erythraea]EQD88166.1 signal peptidase II [Saccharopolyspora erythraea D]PFG98645.1 signal peptidase II [Saccharopolyspora erythraea NRRL 2338]QRK88673.1 signal peptidase II [Saccharopolyspora erythraea]CAM05008.1 lipoprotein signal peptidase [Saccharopolyspora erythraea NRRL 2338]